MAAVFNTTEEIAQKFIEDGWSPNTSFSEMTLEEAKEKEKGYLLALEGIGEGCKYFKMNSTGNIFDDRGELVLFNMRTI